jgi:hypothetical protein
LDLEIVNLNNKNRETEKIHLEKNNSEKEAAFIA